MQIVEQTAGQIAKTIVNNPDIVLPLKVQEELVEIIDKENTELWENCMHVCDDLLNQMELAKQSKLF